MDKVKKVLMEITMDEDMTLAWDFNPDLNRFQMYGVYGLLELIRQQLEIDFHEQIDKGKGE